MKIYYLLAAYLPIAIGTLVKRFQPSQRWLQMSTSTNIQTNSVSNLGKGISYDGENKHNFVFK